MAKQDASPDLRAITERGREVWSSGDFNEIARQTMMVAEDICRVADPRYAYYRSIDHALELFQNYFGPTIRALKLVGEDGAEALRRDLARVFDKYNMSEDGTVVLTTEYLQTVASRA